MSVSTRSEPVAFDQPVSLSPEVLRLIDLKVIAFVRALSARNIKNADEIERVAGSSEPVAAFGEPGAQYLRQALKDARACFELMRPVVSSVGE